MIFLGDKAIKYEVEFCSTNEAKDDNTDPLIPDPAKAATDMANRVALSTSDTDFNEPGPPLLIYPFALRLSDSFHPVTPVLELTIMVLHPRVRFNAPYPSYSVNLPVASSDRSVVNSNLQELVRRLLQFEAAGPLATKGCTTIEWQRRGSPHAVVFLTTQFNGAIAKL